MVHRRNSSVVKPVFPRSKPLLSASSSGTSLSFNNQNSTLPPSSFSMSASSQLTGRRLRVKITVVLTLIVISTALYLLNVSSAMADYYSVYRDQTAYNQLEHHAEAWTRPKPRPHRANTLLSHASNNHPLTLSPMEELAAVSSHLAALPQNVIPGHVDPSQVIDPQLVLDFDVSAGKRSEEELKVLVQQTWEHNPVVVYCKRHSPQSRSLRHILSRIDIQPPPTIFEIDVRPDSEVLMPLIARIVNEVSALQSSSADSITSNFDAAAVNKQNDSTPPISSNPFPLPALLIAGKVVSGGDVEHVSRLLDSGKLKEMIREAGAEVKDAQKKKKGKR